MYSHKLESTIRQQLLFAVALPGHGRLRIALGHALQTGRLAQIDGKLSRFDGHDTCWSSHQQQHLLGHFVRWRNDDLADICCSIVCLDAINL